MIAIGDTLISDDVFSEQFVCHLDKCKGACCVAGDRGAPLKEDDIASINKNMEGIHRFMSAEGISHQQQHGFYETDEYGENVTTCLPTGECSFVVYDKGIASCAIEKAKLAGESDYLKPVSCHLYPIRVKRYHIYDALNYDRWDICKAACSLGKELKVPVYRFLKDALIRRYGADWYQQLEDIAAQGWPPKLQCKEL